MCWILWWRKMIKWGIVGAGFAAEKFAKAMTCIKDSEIYAIASKTNADAFADRFNVSTRYWEYQKLADDPNVNAVYISTIHPLHYSLSLLMLNAGKPVLCEKPAGMNVMEVRNMVETAKRNKIFFMEAMWTKCLPCIQHVKQAIRRIEPVIRIKSEFYINRVDSAAHRLFNKELGGGALLDIGVYPLSFIHMILGVPQKIAPFLYIGEQGVDEIGEVTLKYDNAIAHASFATRCDGLDYATVFGENGKIEIINFHKAMECRLILKNNIVDHFIKPHKVNGFEYEIQEVGKCIRNGDIESKIHTHKDCIEIAEIIEAVQYLAVNNG